MTGHGFTAASSWSSRGSSVQAGFPNIHESTSIPSSDMRIPLEETLRLCSNDPEVVHMLGVWLLNMTEASRSEMVHRLEASVVISAKPLLEFIGCLARETDLSLQLSLEQQQPTRAETHTEGSWSPAKGSTGSTTPPKTAQQQQQQQTQLPPPLMDSPNESVKATHSCLSHETHPRGSGFVVVPEELLKVRGVGVMLSESAHPD